MEIINFYNRKFESVNIDAFKYDSSLNKESNIIQVLITSPQIQLTLGNPKMFIGKYRIP
jgi:hypothetical protein